jgi:hypothetical protein
MDTTMYGEAKQLKLVAMAKDAIQATKLKHPKVVTLQLAMVVERFTNATK